MPWRESTSPGVPIPTPSSALVAVAPDEAVDQAVDDLDRVSAVAPLELDLGRLDHAAAQIDQRATELRRAEVETDRVAAVAVDAQHDRRLAAGRRAAADLLDQAIAQQLGYERGN